MNSTKLYFLLSFKQNEYKQLKIEVLLVKEKNQLQIRDIMKDIFLHLQKKI